MVVLYSPAGRELQLNQRLWQAALREAEAMGWRPAGTCAPPQPLGERSGAAWRGDYTAARGQEVTRGDAREFGRALERSGHARWSVLSAFSLASGFLISEPAGVWRLNSALNRLGRNGAAPAAPRSAPRELADKSA